MHVSPFPGLSATRLLTRPTEPGAVERFYGKEVWCFSHGRGALWRGIKLLGLAEKDKVLVPSYHCGVEVEAVLQANVAIEFYRIKDDLSADLTLLEEQIKAGCKALLVIHYYGFPQPIEAIRQLCLSHNVFLIEDCAHALFSSHGGRPLGTYGDIAIFSPPKSLSLPDGGVLLINNPGIEGAISMTRPRQALVLKRAIGMVLGSPENTALRASLRGIRRLSTRFVPTHTDPGNGDGMDASMGYIGMSEISKRIMSSTPIEWVIRQRRLHFQYLLAGIHDSDHWKVLSASLPDGVCPLFFPIRVRSRSRKGAQRVLEGLGIRTFVFGEQLHRSLPEEDFPEADLLSREVLCLPVHQQLDEGRLGSIVSAMKSLLRTSRTIRAEVPSFDSGVTEPLDMDGLKHHRSGA